MIVTVRKDVVRTFPYNPLGINLNYLLDSDVGKNRTVATQTALSNLNVQFLRYPGGEKSDGFLWSIPPYQVGNSPKLSFVGQTDWPSNDPRFYSNGLINPLDFDEYMQMVQALDAEPVIVINLDSIYRGKSRQQIIQTAAQWVRYANIQNGYGIKYWEIGNESYHPGNNGQAPDATTYANDLKAVALAMKAVDPTISIGANGGTVDWWVTVLTIAGGQVDFLSVHEYPVNWMGGFTAYVSNPSVMRTDSISAGLVAMDQLNVQKEIIVTETNTIDWLDNWPNKNDVGHAIVLTDLLGRMLNNPQVLGTFVWNTRWVDNATKPNELSDTLTHNGAFNLSGKVLALVGVGLEFPEMLSTTSDSQNIVAYAFNSPETKRMRIVLVNRSSTSKTVTIDMQGFKPLSGSSLWGSSSTALTMASKNIVIPSGPNFNGVTITVPKLSVSLIECQKLNQVFMPIVMKN